MTTKKEDIHGEIEGKIACILADGFEDSEFEIPRRRLEEVGYRVEVIGPEAGQLLKGYKGRVTIRVDRSIDDAHAEDYEGLLIPGGQSPDKLRADPRFVKLVQRFDETKRPLAAVCHGPQMLMSAGLVNGRTLTAWPTVQGDLWQMGAQVRDEQVVVDDNWITSRNPDDLEAFSARMIEELRALESRGMWPQTERRGQQLSV